MDKVIREGAVRVGVDLAKHVIQVHAVDAAGRVLTSRVRAGVPTRSPGVVGRAERGARGRDQRAQPLRCTMTGCSFSSPHFAQNISRIRHLADSTSLKTKIPWIDRCAINQDKVSLDRWGSPCGLSPWWHSIGSDHVIGMEPR